MKPTVSKEMLVFCILSAFSLGCIVMSPTFTNHVVVRATTTPMPPPGYEIKTILRPLKKEEDDTSVRINTELLGLINKVPCDCQIRWHWDYYSTKDWSKKQQQQLDSLKRYQRRQMDANYVFNQVHGMSPISYPAHGVSIRPLQATKLEGIKIEWFDIKDIEKKEEFKVQLRGERGVFRLLGSVEHVTVDGWNTRNMTIRTSLPSLLNLQLRHIIYQNTVYDANSLELVDLTYMGSSVKIPIHIQQQRLPWLYEAGSGRFRDRVTVVVKTFLRYTNLRRLIRSIHEFYPGTRIIVADDTPNEFYKVIKGDDVDQFKMPNFTGYFAGRNLGLSQVSTEYFLYTDDDLYLLKQKSDLDHLVSLLDETNFHLVGSLQGNQTKTMGSIFNFKGYGDHTCIERKFDYHSEVPGFPGCFTVDMVTNFFIASTIDVRAVGFDPHPLLSIVGHREFFYSAFGRLRIAVCRNVVYAHERGGDSSFEDYKSRRHNISVEHNVLKAKYELFKNHIGCLTRKPMLAKNFQPFFKS